MRNLWKMKHGVPRPVEEQITGTLSDGTTVTAYNRLPDEVLTAEGWKPLTEDPMPENSENPVIYEIVFEETETEILKHYVEVIEEEEGGET